MANNNKVGACTANKQRSRWLSVAVLVVVFAAIAMSGCSFKLI